MEKRSWRDYAVIIIFFSVLILSGSMIFIKGDDAYSQTEKRYLTKVTDIFKGNFFDGSMQEKTENYLADQFAYRTEIIKTDTATRLLMDKEIAGVYFGRDGFLFDKVTDTNNFVINKNKLAGFSAFCEKADINLDIMIAPTKTLVLSEYLPCDTGAGLMYDQGAIIKELKEELSDYLDLSDSFMKYSERTQLYYKTDHHWTMTGAGLAAKVYLDKLGLSQNSETLSAVSLDFLGSQYSKLLYSDCKGEMLSQLGEGNYHYIADGAMLNNIYAERFLRTNDKYSFYLGGNASVCKITGTGDESRRLLIIKDSYANCFVPFILQAFGEVHMLDLRYSNESVSEYIEANKITDCLVLYNFDNFVTETNIIKLPDETTDIVDDLPFEEPSVSEAAMLMEKIIEYLKEADGELLINKTINILDKSYRDNYKSLYGCDIASVSDGAIAYVNPSTKADEISILKPSQGNAMLINNALKARIDKKVGDFRAYFPEEVEKIEGGIVFSAGQYRVLIIMENASDYVYDIKQIIKENTKE